MKRGIEADHDLTLRMPFTSSPSRPGRSPQAASKTIDLSPASGRHGVSPARTVRPGAPDLNLITDFSRLEQSPQRRGSPKSRLLADKRGNNESVDVRKRPLASIYDADPKNFALSPSDGTLLIGFSIESQKGKASSHLRPSRDRLAPLTPEILITPVGQETAWEAPGSAGRPPSSVYSQATHKARGMSRKHQADSTLPPVPEITDYLKRGPVLQRAHSVTSFTTAWSNDENRHSIERRLSGESQTRIIRRSSFGDAAQHRRSTGWWNQILSPFLDRSSTIKSKRTGTILSKRDLRGFRKDTADTFISGEADGIAEDRAKEENAEPGWSPSHSDPQRRTLAFFRDDSPVEERKPHDGRHQRDVILSPDFVQPEPFGQAAEYYEACYHDENSLTPYYECQNHVCLKNYNDLSPVGSASRRVSFFESDATTVNEPEDQDRARDIAPKPHGKKKTIESLKPAVQSSEHERDESPSNSTDFEDDTQTEVEEEEEREEEKEREREREVQCKNKDSPARVKQSKTVGGDEAVKQEAFEAVNPAPSVPVERSLGAKRTIRSNRRFALPIAPNGTQSRSMEPVSPEAMTPGLRRDLETSNAIPMTMPRAAAPPPSPPLDHAHGNPEYYDPLQIQAPRAAPLPPQTLASREAPQKALSSDFQDRPETAAPRLVQIKGLAQRSRKEGSPKPAVSKFTEVYHEPSVSEEMRQQEQPRSLLMSSQRPANEVPDPLSEPSMVPVGTKEGASDAKPKAAKPKAASPFGGLFKVGGTKRQKKTRKRTYFFITAGLLSMILLILALILFLTLKHDDIPAQDSWLNITGFPPIPTGISTIARPNLAVENDQCVQPTSMWSCAVPKEQQSGIAPNDPDQPNFRFSIRFQNGTIAANSTNSTIQTRSMSPVNAVSAGAFIRERLLRRDSFTVALFSPNPAPPSLEDQAFLGRTTDNNSVPFEGESTPFFISLLPTTTDAFTTAARLARRQDTNATSNSSSPFPDIGLAIPPPSVNDDGTAAAANLLPFPSSQPIRLFNRGKTDEHYGFYTYFDRSIFLQSAEILNDSVTEVTPGDTPGGSEESSARVRCTWTQTRLLIQMWTNAANQLQLLPGPSNGTSTSTSTSSSSNSSADDFSRPGSFPYPVTVTMDRHGGDIATKMIYCYGMDGQEHILTDQKKIHLELRNATGTLVNPALGVFNQVNVSVADGGPGGIDGGTGGCQCQWNNFQQKS